MNVRGSEAGHSFDGPAAEFATLRAETLQLQAHQLTLFTFNLTIFGVLVTLSRYNAQLAPLVLVSAYTSSFLYDRYARATQDMYRAGAYIRTKLARQIPGGLSWEEWVVDDRNEINLLSFRPGRAAKARRAVRNWIGSFSSTPASFFVTAAVSLTLAFGPIFLGKDRDIVLMLVYCTALIPPAFIFPRWRELRRLTQRYQTMK